MAKIVALTQLSPTMSEGVLAKWRKNEGDKVGPGDILAEVETDKANMELESFDKGVLLKRLIGEGTSVKVGAPIAIVGNPGEDISGVLSQTQTTGPAPAKSATPAPASTSGTAMAAPPPKADGAARGPAGPAPTKPSGERVLASPLARSVAKEAGVDITGLSGSGPFGRIVQKDVEAAIQASGSQKRPAAPAAGDFEDVSLSPMRKTIARRLVEAKQKIPHFYLTLEADASAIKAFRAQVNEGVADEEKVSLNDVIVKCVARAMKMTPDANAWFVENGDSIVMRKWRGVHVGIAVALPDGLITPVVRDADRKSLSELARETKDLIGRARQKKLKPEEYTGGTISVSNLGMYGIEEFAAIVNPPEPAILALGTIAAKPVVAKDGKTIVVAERMRMTLSLDHRVIDGALGAQLLDRIKQLIENPLRAVV